MRLINLLLLFVLWFSTAHAATTTTNKVTTPSGDLTLDTQSSSGYVDVISKFKVTSLAGSHPCPSMTDADMLLSVANDGDCVHNTDLNTWMKYNATDDIWEEMGSGGGISNWETGVDYVVDDVVISYNKIYQAVSDHTASANFFDDLAAWKVIAWNKKVTRDLLFAQDFEDTTTANFVHTGMLVDNVAPINGFRSARVVHHTSSTYSFKEYVDVDLKYKSKNVTMKFDCTRSSTATPTVTVNIRDEVANTDIVASEQVACDAGVGKSKEKYIAFDMPATAQISYKFTFATTTGSPVTTIDDVEFYVTKFDAPTSALVTEPDSALRFNSANGFGSTATGNRRFGSPVEYTGSNILYTDSATNGAEVRVASDSICSLSYSEESVANTAISYGQILLNGVAVAFDYARLNTATTSTKASSASWTYKLKTTDVVTFNTGGSGLNTPGAIAASVACQGSVKQVKVNSNQKVKIPTSEMVLTGSSSRGTGAEASTVKFDTLSTLSGDAFTLDQSNGTVITMKKAGKLDIDMTLQVSRYVTTSITVNGLNVSTIFQNNGGTATNDSTRSDSVSLMVKVNDVIRITSNIVPYLSGANYLRLLLQEQEVQVSVSNTLPQFTEGDTLVRAQGNSGQSITADVTNIPFTTTYDSTGGNWNGSQFTVPSNGVYSIQGHTYFTSSATRTLDLYVDGVMYRRVGDVAQVGTNHHFVLQDSFTAGQVLSIRSGVGGTLNSVSANPYHWITITKVGKPNITSVDVTPFVNIPMKAMDVYEVNNSPNGYGSSYTLTPRFTTVSKLRDESVLSYTDSATLGAFWTANKNAEVTVTLSGPYSTASANVIVVKNQTGSASGVTLLDSNLAASQRFSVSGKFYVAAGDRISFIYSSGTFNRGEEIVHVHATATASAIIANTDSFSTDTASLSFSSTYTAATIANAPAGTFITYSIATASNTRTQCVTPPTQSTADMNLNGFHLYAKAFNGAASTCGLPAVVLMKIGAGFKGYNLAGYYSAGKALAFSYDIFPYATNTTYGTFNTYDEKSGVVFMSAGYSYTSATSTAAYVGIDLQTDVSRADGYFVINASKVPQFGGHSYTAPYPAILSDVKASGTAGGSSVATTWNTRTLNTEDDQAGIVTLSGNQFTLGAGEYLIEGSAPSFATGTTKLRIRNITDATTAISGTSDYTTGTASTVRNLITGRILITASKTFEVQHYTQVLRATDGLGVADSTGENEVYSQVKITKLR